MTGIGQRSAWEDCQPQAALARGQSNRYQACQAAGVEPVFADYQDDDPVGFVVSLNLHRRQLSESQRAICAARIANMKAGSRTDLQPRTNSSEVSNKEAAEKFNVGTTAVKSAKQVIRNGIPELTHKVETGQVRVSTAADIKEHGLREPIWLYEGKILDGRNRYQACQSAGVEPVFADYSGEDALAFAVSLNLHRRHLDESQRSICAAKAAKYKVGNPNWANLPNSDKGLTIRQAAEKFNVSERLVKTGKQVLNNGIPELTAKVESGQVRVSTAADIATLPVNEQDIIVGLVKG